MPGPDYEGVFAQRNTATLGSDAPGTGPGSAPTGTSAGSGYGRNTPVMPHPAKKNDSALGYGGGGEGNVFAPMTEQEILAPGSVGSMLAEQLKRYPPGPAVPQYNVLVDSIGTRDGWRYMADFTVAGTFASPANGASVTSVAVVAPTNLPPIRVGQYPGGIQAYLYVRTFQAMVTVTTMTGVFDWTISDPQGYSSAPMGMTPASGGASGLISVDALLRAPIIDQTGTTLATLSLNAINIATTGGNVAWRLGFSYAVMVPVPAFKGYVPLPLGSYRAEGTNTSDDGVSMSGASSVDNRRVRR